MTKDLYKCLLNHRVLMTLASCLFTGVALASTILEPYPGGELVSNETETDAVTHRIITGSLKKLENVLVPKSYEYVVGKRQTEVYYLPYEQKVDRVVTFFKDQLEDSYQILFSCRGRNCGSSSYWANTVFGERLLYGPEQFQRYLVAKAIDSNSYVTIYVGQRGTKKIYVRLARIEATESQLEANVDTIAISLGSNGRFVVPHENFVLTAVQINEIKKFLDEHADKILTLVVHDSLKLKETVPEAVQRTGQLAMEVRRSLVDAGISSDRVAAYGVGPLAPEDHGNRLRLELLVLE